MHDDRLPALVVLDAQLHIGPAHDRRALAPYVHVVETAVAERRSGTQVFARGHAPDLTRRYPIRVEHENLGRIDAELEIPIRRSGEPGMPAKAGGPRRRIPA